MVRLVACIVKFSLEKVITSFLCPLSVTMTCLLSGLLFMFHSNCSAFPFASKVSIIRVTVQGMSPNCCSVDVLWRVIIVGYIGVDRNMSELGKLYMGAEY